MPELNRWALPRTDQERILWKWHWAPYGAVAGCNSRTVLELSRAVTEPPAHDRYPLCRGCQRIFAQAKARAQKATVELGRNPSSETLTSKLGCPS